MSISRGEALGRDNGRDIAGDYEAIATAFFSSTGTASEFMHHG
jgi:hypothetical protein